MDYKAAEHEEAAFVEPVRAENGIVQASYVDLGEPSISGSFPCTQQVLIPSTSSRSNLVSCSSQVSVSSSTAGSPRSLVRVLTSGRASRPRSAGRTGQLARAGGAFAAKAATAALSNNASAPVGGTSSPSTWQRNDSSVRAKMSPGRSPHAVDTSSRPNSTRRNSSPHAPVRTGTGSISARARSKENSPSPPRVPARPKPIRGSFEAAKPAIHLQGSAHPHPPVLVEVLARIAAALEHREGVSAEVAAAAAGAIGAAASAVLAESGGDSCGQAFLLPKQNGATPDVEQLRAHVDRLEHEVGELRAQVARRLDSSVHEAMVGRRDINEARVEATALRSELAELRAQLSPQRASSLPPSAPRGGTSGAAPFR